MAARPSSHLTALCWLLLFTESRCGALPTNDPSLKALAILPHHYKELRIREALTRRQLIRWSASSSSQCPAVRALPPCLFSHLSVRSIVCYSELPESVSSLDLTSSCPSSGFSAGFPGYMYAEGRARPVKVTVEGKSKRSAIQRKQCEKNDSTVEATQRNTGRGLRDTRNLGNLSCLHKDLMRLSQASSPHGSTQDVPHFPTCPNLLSDRKSFSGGRLSRRKLAALTELTLTPVADPEELLQLFESNGAGLPTELWGEILLFRLQNLVASVRQQRCAGNRISDCQSGSGANAY